MGCVPRKLRSDLAPSPEAAEAAAATAATAATAEDSGEQKRQQDKRLSYDTTKAQASFEQVPSAAHFASQSPMLWTVMSAFLLQLLQNGSAMWKRSRLMLIGEGGAGKTSTLRTLLGKDFMDTESTIAMDISKCSLDRSNVTNWREVSTGEHKNFDSVAAELVVNALRKADELTQSNRPSSRPPPPPPAPQTFEWRWQAENRTWKAYDATVQKTLNDAASRGETQVDIGAQANGKCYLVDWSDPNLIFQV